MHKRLAASSAYFSRRGLIAGGLVLAGGTQARAQTVRSETGMDALLEAQRTALNIPALGLGVARRGEPARVIVTGTRTAGETSPVERADRWHLGSLTKAMTATLIAGLVEQGLIGWETGIAEVLGPEMNPAYAGVTLLHLLSHRSGLPANIPLERFDAYRRQDGSDPRGERLAFAREGLALPPVAAPGSAMAYSNLGYVVAASMIEAVAGAPWEALMRQRLFAPLGLASAGFGPPAGAQPRGHLINADGSRLPQMIDNPVAMGPAGRVHMALDDLVRFLAAHAERTPRLLSRQAWKMLHTPHFGGNYALGWVRLADGRLWHNGSNSLWYAEAMFDRRKRSVGAFVSNDGVLTAGKPGDVLLRAMDHDT